MKYVLFVCNHNAGRSQMAQALFERHAPADVRAESAGSTPAEEVWPSVIEAMGEIGIDLSDRRPKKLTIEMQLHADWAVTHGRAATPARTSPTTSRWTGTSPTPLVSRSSDVRAHPRRARGEGQGPDREPS